MSTLYTTASQVYGYCYFRSRMDFMLEILMAIKNNNMRKIPNYDYEHLDHLKKMMKNFTRGMIYIMASIYMHDHDAGYLIVLMI